MKFKMTLLAMTLGMSSVALSHDGGHGPKMTDVGKFGGSLADVKDKSSASVYKSELVKTSDGKIQVKIVDKSGKPIDSSSWDKSASASASSGRKGSEKSSKFELTNDGKGFVGTLPSDVKPPYTLKVSFSEKGNELNVIFANQE